MFDAFATYSLLGQKRPKKAKAQKGVMAFPMPMKLNEKEPPIRIIESIFTLNEDNSKMVMQQLLKREYRLAYVETKIKEYKLFRDGQRILLRYIGWKFDQKRYMFNDGEPFQSWASLCTEHPKIFSDSTFKTKMSQIMLSLKGKRLVVGGLKSDRDLSVQLGKFWNGVPRVLQNYINLLNTNLFFELNPEMAGEEDTPGVHKEIIVPHLSAPPSDTTESTRKQKELYNGGTCDFFLRDFSSTENVREICAMKKEFTAALLHLPVLTPLDKNQFEACIRHCIAATESPYMVMQVWPPQGMSVINNMISFPYIN